MLTKKRKTLLFTIIFSFFNIILYQNCGDTSFESINFNKESSSRLSNRDTRDTITDAPTTDDRESTDDQKKDPTTEIDKPINQPDEVTDKDNKPTSSKMENISADGSLDNRTTTLAFPGARGAGKYATGGRGGALVKVTTRNDNCTKGDGEITWREAIQACGDVTNKPRIIVFNIGGVFHADHNQKHIAMGSGNVTVACQTAPSPVVFTETVHNFSGHKNYIVRHCIHRNDGTPILGPSTDRGWDNTSGAGNAIFDHISVSWTQDSNWIVYQGAGESPPKNFTLQYSNLSRGDGSRETTPGTNDSAVGPVCLGNDPSSRIENCSFIGNFAAHNNTRNNGLWTASGEVFDNVVYNWWDGSIQAIDIMGKGNTSAYWSNNILKRGPANASAVPYNNSGARIAGNDNWFVPLKIGVGSAESRNVNRGTPDHIQIAKPGHDIRQLVSSINSPYVQCNGASAWGMDFYDRKYWKDFYDGTGPTNAGYAKINRDYSVYTEKSWPNNYDTDNDGIADEWEKIKVKNLTTITSQSDQDSDGYTDLEEFINERARCPDIAGF